jgi:very-short-patch-repair endonuclease
MLWSQLDPLKYKGYKFFPQVVFGAFVVDFYCPRLKLVIEVDGASHEGKKEYDDWRTSRLEAEGLRVLRFTNEEVLGDVELVVEKIMGRHRKR